VITKIILKLLPLPESVLTLSAFFPDIDSAAHAASGIIRAVPQALELVDRASLRAAAVSQKACRRGCRHAAVEVDGTVESAAREWAATTVVTDAMRGWSRRVILLSVNGSGLRRSISPALYTIKPRKLNEDIVVPRSRIPDILREIEAIAARHGLLIANFGHAGDGNIHTNIMIDDEDLTKAEIAVKEIFAAALRMDGSISGEHGIGLSKAAYLPMELSPAALAAMKRIKQALDPKNILNPGKIFGG
jgi:glycolate oxidase